MTHSFPTRRSSDLAALPAATVLMKSRRFMCRSPPRSGVNTVWWSIRLRSRRRALARRRRGAAQYTFQQARRQALRPVTGYRVTADHDQPLVATHRSQCLVGNGIGAEPIAREPVADTALRAFVVHAPEQPELHGDRRLHAARTRKEARRG